MSGLVHHLVRRGIEETHQRFQKGPEEGNTFQIPAWGAATLLATVVMYAAVMFGIDYTYGHVVSVLTMIESPTVTAFKIDGPEPDETDPLYQPDLKDSKNTLAAQEELLIVKTKPITAKIRTTMKHLRAQAGPWSRFRGLHVYILYHLLYVILFNFLSAAFSRTIIPQPVAAVLTSVALCRWNLLWTHSIISTPSTRSFWQRIPKFDSVKKILMPAAMCAVAEQVAIYVPNDMFRTFGLSAYSNPEHFGKVGEETQKHALFQLLMVAAVGIVTSFLILLPATVTLTRVQASLLPEEEETIVPLDRSFGGKVEPRIVGGTGAVSMLDAWKTFDYAARIRLVKLYVKIFLIEAATTVFFVTVGAAEMKLILAKSQVSK
ncbi:hypothetical protein MMC07_008775 [Pseudocyphellaria aurata]|nr:hypothetical protein [Pseudocyphellaria aurata]